MDLGVHRLPGVGITKLMQVMPVNLKGRVFAPPPRSLERITPGIWDAPPLGDGVAFVFTYPALGHPETEQEQALVNAALRSFAHAARNLLHQKTPHGRFTGYECQEVSAGCFMLAFPEIGRAISFSTALQEALLSYAWPADLLQVQGWEEEVDGEDRVVNRGLRVQVGRCTRRRRGGGGGLTSI